MSARTIGVVFLAACTGLTDAQTPTPSRSPSATEPNVRVEINAAAPHQLIEGFGATAASLIYQNGADDKLPPNVRKLANQAVYGDVRITLGNVEIGAFEPANDDADPFHLNQSALELPGLTAIADKVLVPARALGADALYPGNTVNVLNLEWLKAIRVANYARYLDECAEYIVASVLKWRDATGDIPRFHELFNEPTAGEIQLQGGGAQEMIDIIKRAGARLRSAGMPTKFIVPSDESVTSTITTARAVLADAQARQYVGAIGYHVYPYGSPYASMPRILSGPGRGRRDDNELMQRRALRDLGRQYNIPLWMTEVSHGEVDPRTMDALRARAIHIHDELAYADASAFFGMLSMWDSQSNIEHFGPGRSLLKEEDSIVLIDLPSQSVTITGTGYAIGHYARWVQRGALRVETASDDSLVMVSAFTDNRRGKASFVVINNADDPKTVRLHLNSLALTGPLTGEQSYEEVRFRALGAIAAESGAGDAFVVTVPARSVTSLGGSY
jgi:O-glycosyl hydrolase